MMTEPQPDDPALALRVIVLAPVGRDATLVCERLTNVAIVAEPVRGIDELLARMTAGAGTIVIAEEALTPSGFVDLAHALDTQPSWSDLPVILLLAEDDSRTPHELAPGVAALAAARTITLVQRPVPAAYLITAVKTSLRTRARQYQVRDLLVSERAAREQAESATRIKDEFLATVSHELRTPIGAIVMWAELLELGQLADAQVHRAHRAILAGARAQSKLIEDLLDVARMLSGTLKLDVQPRVIGPVVEEAVDVIRPTAEAKGVLVRLAIEPDVIAIADADRVRQIAWNLVNNAVKFTAAGGFVSVSLRREGDAAVLRVADTGQGIEPELLPHVFERFLQGEGGSARRHGGLGLGLAIVRQLTELHGGTIHAHSQGHGCGSTFTVRLPTAERPNQAVHAS